MSVVEKIKHIGLELRGHAPFTVVGALLGIGFMLVFRNVSQARAGAMFSVFHPGHVLLSAMVTASLFRLHAKGKNFLFVLAIGFFGAIGVATVSDSVIPFFGETILGVVVPTHGSMHGHEHVESGPAEPEGHAGHDHGEHAAEAEHVHDENSDHAPGLHLGFIEDWWIVTPAAIIGVLLAYAIPRTRCPHAAHVLLSTWASSSHVLMNTEAALSVPLVAGWFVVLFVAVWLPCCVSDIVFPLLFVGSDVDLKGACVCTDHAAHSHEHTHKHDDDCGGEDA